MKKTILKFLVIISFLNSQQAVAYKMPAALLDIEQLSVLVESGSLDSDQYQEAMDIIESGGDVLNTVALPLDEEAVSAYEIQQEQKRINIENGTLQNIAGDVGADEVQNFSVKQTVGHGDWAFEFLFIDKSGNKKIISSYNANKAMRPGSTMKLFTSWAAFKRGTYPLKTMTHMLKYSNNTEADDSLRSVSKANPSYVLPANSFLNSIIGYKMWDSLAGPKKRNGKRTGANQTIDRHIAKGCSIIQTDYSSLEDYHKFHQVNGSGLQQSGKDREIHSNKVTTRLEIALLRKILYSGSYDKYKKMLPNPGNGTLTFNFKELRKSAKIYAKTGTLGNSKALAGFVEIPQGTVIFSIISDNLRGLGSDAPKAAMKGPIEDIVYKNVMYALQNAK